MRPSETLRELAGLYEERNKQYGDSYKEAGAVFAALFPNGVTLESIKDFNRFAVLMHIVNKLKRYCNNWDKQRIDPDHTKDISVYATMLNELDDGVTNE